MAMVEFTNSSRAEKTFINFRAVAFPSIGLLVSFLCDFLSFLGWPALKAAALSDG